MDKVAASIERLRAARDFKHTPHPPSNPVHASPSYWGDWSGYRGVGDGHIAQWIKDRDPVYTRTKANLTF